MKKPFADNSTITSWQLTPDDLLTYRSFCAGLPDPERYADYLADDGARLAGKECGFVLFGLRDGEEMVGQAVIAFDPDNPYGLAVFCEAEITPAYQRRGLANHLHDARTQYLRDIGFNGEIETHIKPDNRPSLEAAERNGFTRTEEMHKGFCVLRHG